MHATIIISLIAILFAWIARFQKTKYGGLEVAFILLTVFMSIRYNFGNDYPAYLKMFQDIETYSLNELLIDRTEIGWLFLNNIFQPIGFFGMVIVLTVFEYIVIYRLIKKYVPKEWYWLSVFILTFNAHHMLVFSSMMRQFLAICVFILAIEFIIEKRWILSILLVLLASLFHTSALILLPFCFLGFLNISLTKKAALIWFSLYIVLYFVAAEIFRDYFIQIVKIDQFERYEGYIGGERGEKGTGLGELFNMIIYLFILFHQRYQSDNMKLIFTLFAISYFFYIFSEIAPLTSRIGYYFSVFSIICFPLMFKAIKNNFLKYTLLTSYLVFTILHFQSFFSQEGIWYDHFYTYQTIFSSTSWM